MKLWFSVIIVVTASLFFAANISAHNPYHQVCDSQVVSPHCPAPPPVVVPPVVVPQPSFTFLCYSKFLGSVPEVVNFDNVPDRLAVGEFAPYAVSQDEATKQGIPTWKWNVVGGYVLVCNTDGLTLTGTGVNGSDGTLQDAAAWKVTLAYYGLEHVNHYEIAR